MESLANSSRRLLGWVAIAGIAAVALVYGVHAIFDDPPEGDREAWIYAWHGVGQDHRAVAEIAALADENPSDVWAQYRWIISHFAVHGEQDSMQADDEPIEARFAAMAESGDPTGDIGRYGLGLIAAVGDNDRELALERFELVQNRSLPYLNNSIGNCLRKLDRPAEALPFFEREIQIGGNVDGASRNLARALLALDRSDELAERIAADERFGWRLPRHTLRELAWKRGDVGTYLKLTLSGQWSSDADGFIAALLVLVVWLFFLRGLDVFEPEKPWAIGVALGLGMATACGPTTVLYDFVEFVLGAELGRSMLSDMFYCVGVIGLIEESVKLLPLLAIMKWTREVNEPVDVVIYGASSALGFAFLENLLYFSPVSLTSIHARAFTATVLHMGLTTIAAYGLLQCRCERKPLRRCIPRILGWFAFAVTLHGFYDLVLLGSGWLQSLRALSLVFLIFVVGAFRTAASNGLSWSPFWNEQVRMRIVNRWWYLALTLSSVLFFEIVLLARRFGPTAATLGFLGSAMASAVLILILLGLLGLIPVTRFRWLPILNQ